MSNILKYPGSKWTIARWIVGHFPEGYERMTYIEPFFGSGAVFFTKQRSQIETINDLDDDVVNLFRCARDFPEELARAVALTPWSRTEYAQSYDREDCDNIERARRFLTRMWQGIGAKSSSSTGWRKNIKGANGNAPRFHLALPDEIMAVCERLKHANGSCIVQIENADALILIERHNRADALIYADPPYDRATRSGRMYKHEYTVDDHRRLLRAMKNHKGPAAISGYGSPLYDATLAGWRRYETTCRTESAQKRTEVLWCNYDAARQMEIANA